MAQLEKNTEHADRAGGGNPFIEKIKTNHNSRDARNARYYFAQYCGSTSIHGMQYLGERGRYIIEKIVWLIIIITVATLSSILISKTYKKWVTTPVIVTFATTEKSISSIPFPAITICPEVKTNPDIFNFTHAYLMKAKNEKMTELEEELFQSLSLVCNPDIHHVYTTNLDEEIKYVNDSIVENLFVLSSELDPLGITVASWMGNLKNVSEFFTPTFTSEGVCYTFNMLNIEDIIENPENYTIQHSVRPRVKEWSLDYGYSKSATPDSYPRRTYVPGPTGGFLFDTMATIRSHLDYICKESLQGFKVVLHNPAELPNMERHFRVPLNSAVYVGVKPRVTTVSETLKDYDPKGRKCYFVDERPLAFFKDYTQNNCLQECQSNYTLRMCKCLGFYMPKNENDSICGLGSLNCLQNSRVDYLKLDNDKCSCLPSCSALEYDLEISLTDWDWHRAFTALRAVGLRDFVQLFENVHLSRLVVYYKDIQFLNTERNELYGLVDFLSNIGGLLGLFIGISLTSFIEILYFCTLRLYCNFKKYGRPYWSGEQDFIDEDERNDNQAL